MFEGAPRLLDGILDQDKSASLKVCAQICKSIPHELAHLVQVWRNNGAIMAQ